jgi:hypothetical protein
VLLRSSMYEVVFVEVVFVSCKYQNRRETRCVVPTLGLLLCKCSTRREAAVLL